MASIETLIAQVENKALGGQLAREVTELKKRLDGGLVFERHLPENVWSLSAPIRPGSVVWERVTEPRRLRVRSIDGSYLLVVAEPESTTAAVDAPVERVARSDVLVEQDFAESVFPTLTPIEALRNAASDRPHHAVICGENYHAIQALLVAYERKFDAIYLDPPYNTGNRDWSYNNDYVDPFDTYRPSKWLAFMERRLRIARRLLRPDGVLVVTIDENEVHHLGMLLEQVFPEYDRQMVTMVTNPKGTIRGNFGRVDEHAFFCVPKVGRSLIAGRLVEDQPDDDEDEEADEDLPQDPDADEAPESAADEPETSTGDYEFQLFRRRGSASLREDRPNRFFPIFINEEERRIVDVGDTLPLGQAPDFTVKDGLRPIWPIDSDGNERVWRWQASRVRAILDQPDVAGRYLVLGRFNAAANNWTINLAVPRRNTVKQKTVWWEKRHDSGTHGTTLLAHFLGRTRQFSYPKSLYLVRDTLDLIVRDRPDALILDFFAGSGTTLHATALLNLDGGRRRCVLVTNNELDSTAAENLAKAGKVRGDPDWEAAGVFEKVTRKRVKAAISGLRPDGKPVRGRYLDKRLFASGLPENVEFFRLAYLDPAEVEFGLRFADLHPLLWLRAGGIGEREELDPSRPLGLPTRSPYAVVFDPSGLPELLAVLPKRMDIAHVFIVADSSDTYAALVEELPRRVETVRLYRDYLETMRGATR
jgi:adenine-specific DNA-methyltransferase